MIKDYLNTRVQKQGRKNIIKQLFSIFVSFDIYNGEPGRLASKMKEKPVAYPVTLIDHRFIRRSIYNNR